MEQILIKLIPYIVLAFIGGVLIYLAYRKPKQIKEWLINACGVAEAYFGSGTGQLKLRKVWAMFIEQFPIFSNFVSFKRFSGWVEEALAIFKRWLDLNPQAAAFFGETDAGDDNEE
jgi:hypothetical protein